MTFPPLVYIGALVMGSFIGMLVGLFGVGGGFLMTPLLNVLLGVSMPMAVGTGVLQILGSSTASIYRRRNDNLTDWKMAVMLFGGNYVGVRLGTRTLNAMRDAGQIVIRGHEVPAGDFYPLLVFFFVLAAIGAWMLYDTSRPAADKPRESLLARVKLPPYTTFPTLSQPVSIPILAYLGLLLGFITGLLGIGGGVILLPVLVYLVGMRTHAATATSTVMVGFTSLLATITHTLSGNASLLLALPLIVGGSVGVQVGITLADRMKGAKLRRYFCLVMLAAVALIGSKLITMIF